MPRSSPNNKPGNLARDARRERQAAELRANLKRRKEKARASVDNGPGQSDAVAATDKS